jgi:Clp amino terminal domain, pathogenicity island component
VRDRLTDQARRVLELARAEADRLGQRYLGPEHVVLGVLDDGTSAAAQALRAQGLELDEGRAELARLADRGEVARPRPSDAELLGALGIDLDAVRQRTEQTFGGPALGRATREATRARRRGIARVPRTPLEGPPLLISRTPHFAGERANTLGHATVGPELLLLGVLDDITKPWPRCMSNRWRRRLLAHLGLPSSYRGAARPLLEAYGVNLEDLRDALGAHVQGARP